MRDEFARFVRWHCAMGMTLFLLACLSGGAFAQGDDGGAQLRQRAPRVIEHAEEPTNVNEDIIAWLNRKADKYWHDGDYEGAVNCLNLITILEPHRIEAYDGAWYLLWSMAVSAEQENKKTDAEKYHQRAVKVLERGTLYNPNVYDIYYEFGQYYWATKQYEKARVYLARAAQFKDAPVPVKRNWAHACERSGDLKACVEVWQMMLKENPTDAVALNNLRRVQAKMANDQ
jgi:tetratricopeptide (TPR) repeat protein